MTIADRLSPTAPADRLAACLTGLERWHAAQRRDLDAVAARGISRERRLDAAHQLRVRERQHEVIVQRTALALAGTGDGSRYDSARPRAVVAHRHAWSREKLAAELTSAGVDVLCLVDNGAEAVGLCVAEQPDLLIVDDLLSMMPGAVVAAEVRQFSPRTLIAGYVQDEQRAGALVAAGATAVHGRRVPPTEVVTALAEALRRR